MFRCLEFNWVRGFNGQIGRIKTDKRAKDSEALIMMWKYEFLLAWMNDNNTKINTRFKWVHRFVDNKITFILFFGSRINYYASLLFVAMRAMFNVHAIHFIDFCLFSKFRLLSLLFTAHWYHIQNITSHKQMPCAVPWTLLSVVHDITFEELFWYFVAAFSIWPFFHVKMSWNSNNFVSSIAFAHFAITVAPSTFNSFYFWICYYSMNIFISSTLKLFSICMSGIVIESNKRSFVTQIHTLNIKRRGKKSKFVTDDKNWKGKILLSFPCEFLWNVTIIIMFFHWDSICVWSIRNTYCVSDSNMNLNERYLPPQELKERIHDFFFAILLLDRTKMSANNL